MTGIEETVNELVEALNKRKKYLQQIKTLAQQQKNALEKEDLQEISSVLVAREQVMKEVDALDTGDGRAKAFMQTFVGSDEPEEVPPSEALRIAGEIESLIREIQSIDRSNLAMAEQAKEDLGRELQKISDHRKSRQLYKREGKGIFGAFINKRG